MASRALKRQAKISASTGEPGTRFDPARFKRKRACVLGLGRSGLAVSKLLAKKGFSVFASDTRPRKEIVALMSRMPSTVRWEAAGHSDRVLACHFAVKSPGIHPHSPILKKLRAAGIPVFSELEVALAFCPTREIIAITGTNGKTTTTHLTAAIFRAAKRRVVMAGNVGDAVSGEINKIKKKDTLVLEVSSYQLEDSRYFHPSVAAVLNITSDHLDHHGSMQSYLASKARIYRFQNKGDTCIFNAADPLVVRLSRDCRARKLLFGPHPAANSCAWLEGEKIRIRLPGSKKSYLINPPKLPGAHNLENAMAAALLTLACEVPATAIARAFRQFPGVEHRLEDCGIIRGLRCVNDSKATNVDSTLAALKSLPSPEKRLLLILGGLAKPGGFFTLKSAIASNVKGVLTIGNAAPKIEQDLQDATHVFPCKTLVEAVRVAFQIGHKGDTLLLSPACASFDQFKNFEDRGRQFKALVQRAKSSRLP